MLFLHLDFLAWIQQTRFNMLTNLVLQLSYDEVNVSQTAPLKGQEVSGLPFCLILLDLEERRGL